MLHGKNIEPPRAEKIEWPALAEAAHAYVKEQTA
jgi:hypothetical protein